MNGLVWEFTIREYFWDGYRRLAGGIAVVAGIAALISAGCNDMGRAFIFLGIAGLASALMIRAERKRFDAEFTRSFAARLIEEGPESAQLAEAA